MLGAISQARAFSKQAKRGKTSAGMALGFEAVPGLNYFGEIVNACVAPKMAQNSNIIKQPKKCPIM